MNIAIIGGMERSAPDYERLANKAGHTVFYHSGHLGAGARALERLMERCELVVILTEINSHGAVLLARKRLRQLGRSPLLLRRLSPARFAELLAALETNHSQSATSA